ncbi:hypothetical protein B566_EDAN016183 [Ephemera danica]|nr:hypothetical protein B566_EDAN016183 [Ephemera danica]
MSTGHDVMTKYWGGIYSVHGQAPLYPVGILSFLDSRDHQYYKVVPLLRSVSRQFSLQHSEQAIKSMKNHDDICQLITLALARQTLHNQLMKPSMILDVVSVLPHLHRFVDLRYLSLSKSTDLKMGDCDVLMPENETDVKRKKARIYLAKSAINSSGKRAAETQIIKPATETQEEGIIPMCAKIVEFHAEAQRIKLAAEKQEEGIIPHWAIVVEFYEYNFWVQIDGVQNDGKLKGCYVPSLEKPVGTFYEFKDVSVIFPIFSAGFPNIHEIEISPNDLYRIAKYHPYNNKNYNILNMRCYEWASEAANIIYEQLNKGMTEEASCKIM